MERTKSKIAGYEFPEGRHYDGAHHLWAELGPDGSRVTIGIDRLGLEALGELAYISFRPLGTRITRGESFGTLEAAKMTTDVIAPVSGTLVELNETALRDPLLVNRDPYDKGWLIVLEPTDWAKESTALVSGAAVPGWVAAEVKRYRAEGWVD